MAGIVKTLLSISPTEATFARRRFHFLRDSARERLERVGETFLRGYNLALADQGIESLAERLNEIDFEFRGYGFEGAAMGLDILDQIQPWKARRIDNFLHDSGKPHIYMVHVGVGWSMVNSAVPGFQHPVPLWFVVCSANPGAFRPGGTGR